MRSTRANTQYIDSNLLNIRKLPIATFNISNKRLSRSASGQTRNHTSHIEAKRLCQGLFKGLPCKIVFIKKQNTLCPQRSYITRSRASELSSRSSLSLHKILEKRVPRQ